MASVLQLNTFDKFQTYHSLDKLESIIDGFKKSLTVEYRVSNPEQKKAIESFKKELEDLVISDESQLNLFLKTFTERLESQGFSDVITNAYARHDLDSHTTQNDVSLQKVQATIPKEFQKYLHLSNEDFHANFENIDNEFSYYQQTQIMRLIHHIYANNEFSDVQKLTFIFSTFVTNRPEDTKHMHMYLKSVGEMAQTYLKQISTHIADELLDASVAEALSLAIGHTVGIFVSNDLTQYVNKMYILSDESDNLFNKVNNISVYNLSSETAEQVSSNPEALYCIKKLLDTTPESFTSLVAYKKVISDYDFLYRTAIGDEFFPIPFESLIYLMQQPEYEVTANNAFIHTLLSVLQIQLFECD